MVLGEAVTATVRRSEGKLGKAACACRLGICGQKAELQGFLRFVYFVGRPFWRQTEISGLVCWPNRSQIEQGICGCLVRVPILAAAEEPNGRDTLLSAAAPWLFQFGLRTSQRASQQNVDGFSPKPMELSNSIRLCSQGFSSTPAYRVSTYFRAPGGKKKLRGCPLFRPELGACWRLRWSLPRALVAKVDILCAERLPLYLAKALVISSQGWRSTVAAAGVPENVPSRRAVQIPSSFWSIRERCWALTKFLAKARGTRESLQLHASCISRLFARAFFVFPESMAKGSSVRSSWSTCAE